MKKKLKKKIWIISAVILIAYITAVILNPTALIALLPIIIPSFGLTVGIPIYSITKYVKDSMEKETNTPVITAKEKNTQNNQNIKQKEKTVTNKINNNALNTHYESEVNQEEKVKIKTKGTIR